MEKAVRKKIRDSLVMQMRSMGMTGDHFVDLADDYMKLYDTKMALQADIDKRGAKVINVTATGVQQLRSNDSIQSLLKVNKTMVDMLKTLGLNIPDQAAADDTL